MASVYFARLRRTTPAGCGECAELAARQRSCSWRLTGARSLRQRLRSFEMLLQGWESLTRIRSGRVALLLRSLLLLGDFLLVILDHLARELPIEGLTRGRHAAWRSASVTEPRAYPWTVTRPPTEAAEREQNVSFPPLRCQSSTICSRTLVDNVYGSYFRND